MPHLFCIPKEHHIPRYLSSLRFGSLTTNPAYPHQGYFDPSLTPSHPELTVKSGELKNFEEVRGSLHYGKLQAIFTQLATLSLSSGATEQAKLSVSLIKSYGVDNSDAWFDTICGITETRQWMEKEIMKGKNIYLVVGCMTFNDTQVHHTGKEQKQMSVTAADPNSGMGAGAILEYGRDGQRHYEAPGERILAVQYRKVKFNFFATKDVDGAFLEPNNRWEQIGKFKAAGMQDGIEARLTDESLDEEGYKKAQTEDGSKEFSFYEESDPSTS